MPDCDIDRDAPLISPVRLRLNVAAKAECLGVAGLCGVTQYVNGRRAVSAICKDAGTSSGSAEMKGESSDGLEWCNDLSRIKSAHVAGLDARHHRFLP